MKKAIAAALILAHCVSAIAVNRCTIEGKTVYQDPPCPGTLGVAGDEIRAKEAEQRKAAAKPVQAVPAAQPAAQHDAIDRLTTYTTVLGRGIACNARGTEEASRSLGAWMQSSGLNGYTMTAAAGIRAAAEQQRAGRSPDTCAKVRQTFPTIAWP